MYFIDGKMSTVYEGIVGTGGIAKGDLCVITSNTIVKAAAAATVKTVIGIATEAAVDTAMASIELCGDRIIRAPYAGTASNLGTNKIFDLTDSTTVNINDVADGSCFCVGYSTANTTIDFIVPAAQRVV
jgi:hypothetical protein